MAGQAYKRVEALSEVRPTVYKRVHGIASFYMLSEFSHPHQVHGYNTKSRDLLFSGLFRKQLSTKEALE